MPTVRGWAFLGAGTALGILWWILGDPELLLVGIFLSLATIVAIVLVHFRASDVSIVRNIGSEMIHDGDVTTVTLTLDPREHIVRDLAVSDRIEELGAVRFEVAALSPGEPAMASYRVICRPRGVYRVGPATASVTDPLRLAEKRLPDGFVERLVVFPMIESLRLPSVSGRHLSVEANRPQHSQQGGEDFYTLREYLDGDDLRRVHWPTSAKTDDLMIRQLETPWEARALVVLDVRSSVYETDDAFETAVSGAASVITNMMQRSLSADLWTGTSTPHDASSYRATMERLAVITTDDIDLGSAVSRLRSRGGGGTLVLITGVTDHDLLAAHNLLAPEYANTVVMSVSSSIPQTLLGFQKLGATTVVVPPGASWATAWQKSVKGSWDAVSVS